MARRVLVTGSAGFLGSHLSMALDSSGWEVYGLDRLPSVSSDAPSSLFCRHDLESGSCPNLLERSFEAVVHLAALLPVGRSEVEAERRNNLITENMIRVLRNLEVGHLVFLSSSSVFDPRRLGPLAGETSEQPISGYGRAKLLSEEKLSVFSEARGIPYTILRPTPILGPGRGGIFNLLRELVRMRFPLFLPTDDRLIFQLAGVNSVSSAVTAELERGVSGLFGIGNPQPKSIAAYLDGLPAPQSSRARITRVPARYFGKGVSIASRLRLGGLTRWHSAVLTHPHYFDESAIHPLMAGEPSCQKVVESLFVARNQS